RIAALVAEFGIQCDFRRMAAYTYTEQQSSVRQIESEVSACQLVGLPATLTSDTDLPYPVAAAVRLANQAMFHPRKFAQAAARIIAEQGGQVFEQTRATHVEEESASCSIETNRGTLGAEHVVV